MIDGASTQIVRAPVERETIRVGVIGTRFGAQVHIPTLQQVDGVELTAVCSSQITNARSTARESGIDGAFDDYHKLLESGDIDAVTVAAPPYLHHSMVLAACDAGVHVLCEKPLAVSAAEARDMLKMATDAGICHAVAFQRRWEPARRRMKQLIDEGFIGDLHSVSVIVYRSALSAARTRNFDWFMEQEKGGGVLAAIGSHYIDQLRWWFGEMIAVSGAVSTAVRDRQFAGGDSYRVADSDDNVVLVIRFASGAIGAITISYTAVTDVGEELVASGSEGMLAIQEPDRLVGARHGGQVQSMLRSDSPRLSGDQREIVPFSRLVERWIRAMRSGEDATPSFEDGVKVQEVVDGVTRSQHLNRWIDLSGNKWPV